MQNIFLAALLLLSTACAAAQGSVRPALLSYDGETNYTVEEEENGFLLTVYQSRGQIIPGRADMTASCRDKLKEVAASHAANQRREIFPPEDNRIRVSQDHNGFSGMTNCTAFTHVRHRKQRP